MGNGLEWSKADDIEQVKRLVPRGTIVYAAQRHTKGGGGTVWVDVPGVGCVPARPWAVERVPAGEVL